MTLEAAIASAVEAAVGRAVEPLRQELAELRRHQDKEAVTIKEAAARLRLSTRTLHRLLRSGEIRSVLLGGSRRIPLAEVLAYEARQE